MQIKWFAIFLASLALQNWAGGCVKPRANYGLPLEECLLSAVPKENGYRTMICGKWYLASIDQT